MATGITQLNRQTWDRVLAGDVTAYQSIVESHQSSVSAVAYSIVGDFPISQDIAQETFWIAWTKRNSLRDASRLGSWLCGIARNLARQWRRKSLRQRTRTAGEFANEPADTTPDPAEQSIAIEEQKVVWSALQEIPDNYREVLTLYYRQGQSIAEVAGALDITEESARQRLSRGRTMLRGRVSQLIEGVLVRSKPDKSFTAKVIAGLAGAGMIAKTATASATTVTVTKAVTGSAGIAAAKGVFATGASVGILGGFLGALGGLAGGFLGTWIPAQLAPTETERQMLLQQGRITFRMALVFTIATFALSLSYVFFRFSPITFAVILLILMAAFTIPIVILAVRLSKQVKNLRHQISANDDPSQSPFSATSDFGKSVGMDRIRKGRRYTSDLALFGYPLIDIQFSDLDFTGKSKDAFSKRHARGWIAIGDSATGILFAAGGIAKGFIAFGGVAIGAISLGGVSAGIISLGGLAIGLLAFGGGAVGYDAVGGAAIGWHSAAGGAAIAWHAATGGLAVAHDFAVGGSAYAAQANTPVAEQVIQSDTGVAWLDWLARNTTWFVVGIILISVLPTLSMRWVYSKRDPKQDGSANKP